MLQILLTRSFTYTSTVKRDFKVHPKVGEQTTQESLQSTNSLTSVSEKWPEVRIPCLCEKSNKEGQFSTVLSTKKSVGSQAELLPINSQPPVAEKILFLLAQLQILRSQPNYNLQSTILQLSILRRAQLLTILSTRYLIFRFQIAGLIILRIYMLLQKLLRLVMLLKKLLHLVIILSIRILISTTTVSTKETLSVMILMSMTTVSMKETLSVVFLMSMTTVSMKETLTV